MAPPNNFIQSKSFRRSFLAHLDGKALKPEQLLQLKIYCYMTLRSWENIHYQFRSGMLSNEEWKPFRKNLKLLLQISMYKEYWHREKEIYAPAFRACWYNPKFKSGYSLPPHRVHQSADSPCPEMNM